ncbi:monovalent cation/H+ antiporter subunit B [Arsukibacterium sp. MJ3]|uniref:Na+/H+ antiporter subunit B n=1 Tax=Arsukibacterium sp. MJ3 TaxID=1632859 RepID=UPI00062716AA|nr:Na+/H+ antiporter subunit B [Arsukibacterium sp. MJ3]KKO49572.1 monovalent cation/H+ antiporter subunit B [Arsukibacterium sp. MJ3]
MTSRFNMRSLILSTGATLLLPLLILFSLFLLLRGHNEPGGGFIGGLVAAAAISLKLFAEDYRAARTMLRVHPLQLVGVGLVLAAGASLPALFVGESFFTAQWWTLNLPILGSLKLSTPLIFDIGVYLGVVGSVLTVVFTLAEAEHS